MEGQNSLKAKPRSEDVAHFLREMSSEVGIVENAVSLLGTDGAFDESPERMMAMQYLDKIRQRLEDLALIYDSLADAKFGNGTILIGLQLAEARALIGGDTDRTNSVSGDLDMF